MKKRLNKAALFIALTLLVSWSMAILFFAFGGKWMTNASFVMAVIYMFIPMLIAVIIQKVIYKEPIKQPLGISFKLNRWFVIAWLLPVIMVIAAIGVSITLPGVEFTTDTEVARVFEHLGSSVPAEHVQKMQNQMDSLPLHLFWFVLLQGLIAGITINAVAGFGEELGWRGFLQKEFSYMGFWKSSVVIGLIWGIWHAPIMLQGHNYPGHPVAGLFMMIILCVLLSPIFSYVRLRANSVIAAAVIHGTLNAVGVLPLVVIKGGNSLTVGITGLAGFVVLICVNIGLVVYDRFFAKEPVILTISDERAV
ncbi:MAG: CPBP family intramembrane metalloprotease [Planctomycetes bacterium]|nr:CPBP family intramembrane metalloprotease [Planctomycetota bacterium]